ncbi:sulfatase [Mangrovactinospora gilvigrisea]|uniref:Sulfatase n=1 Tax=Mangrovactinospora gilvigrisea TaxID=1428644 RepID=A0A1J7B9J2_9ACTN|nr:sulfatase [Mangrovactinospora gilvigrisea]OIV35278.1 sulfatase [Mangrovactinospora gilvigrisea]
MPRAEHQDRPNIVLFMTDDHAAPAIGAYGSVINETPAVDRLAAEGALFGNTFCTNSICSPARGTLLTGVYSHVHGMTTLAERGEGQFDATQPSFPAMLQAAGYQTAIVGKWHLGHGGKSDPHGFDHWEVLPHHGVYSDPTFLTPEGEVQHRGYVTDIITDRALEWIDARDPDRPFCILVQHKAPHREWEAAERHRALYTDVEIPAPPTLHDDMAGRAKVASEARMHLRYLREEEDLKEPVPEGLTEREETEWRYQRYIKNYLRTVASLDEGVGRVLDRLDETGLSADTMVVYTSDHGFFLGEHGWFDKRFMYEEALRIPLVVRWPGVVPAGQRREELVANIDFAPTLLDAAGVAPHPRMQGRSLLPLLEGGDAPADWRDAVYYRYFEHFDLAHRAPASFGVRTGTHKLICYPGQGRPQDSGASAETHPEEWELFDLVADPRELRNVYADPAYATPVAALKDRLTELQTQYEDVV